MKTRYCTNNRYATWLPLGIAIGVATDQLAMWLALGGAIGVALDARQSERND